MDRLTFTILLFTRALNEHKITPGLIIMLFLAAPFAMATLAWFSLWLGKKAENRYGSSLIN